MIESIQIFLGLSLLSLAAFYMVWTKLRVLILRQQLFEVRDDLWNEARVLDRFNDTAYQEARDSINSLIRTAHKVSFPVLVYVVSTHKTSDPSVFSSSSPEMQKAIDKAVTDSVRHLLRYALYYRPFSGIIWMKVLLAVAATVKGFTSFGDNLATWFRGGGPKVLDSTPCT